MNETAPSHRSRLSHPRFRRPLWISAQLKFTKPLIPRPMTLFLFIRKWTQKSLLGHLPKRHCRIWWIQRCVCRRKPVFHPAVSRKTKKEIRHGDVFSSKGGGGRGECRSTPARHAANPYPKKSHPMLNSNSKHSLNLWLWFYYVFWLLCIYTDTCIYVSLTMHINTGTYLYGT